MEMVIKSRYLKLTLEGARNPHTPKNVPSLVWNTFQFKAGGSPAPLKVAHSLEVTKPQVIRGFLQSSVTVFITMPRKGREAFTPAGSDLALA